VADNITRKEIKYRISGASFKQLSREFVPHLRRDKFFFEKIHNIYFDNASDELIRISLERPIFKEKLRLRAYELDGSLYPYVFAELKRKYKGIVYKRRSRFPLSDVREVLKGEKRFTDILGDDQISEEMRHFIERTSIFPKLYLSYDRYSYRAKEDDDLRITFDQNIVSRTKNLDLAVDPALDVPLLGEDECIMEIKSGYAFPLWLTSILTRHRIFSVTFTKYGKIFEDNLRKTPLKEISYV